MNATYSIELAAILCFVFSLFIGKNAIWVTLIAGAVIAGGWVLDDMTNGSNINWTAARQIIAVAILAGAGWEIISRFGSILQRKSLGR